jgi:hypothetical protein
MILNIAHVPIFEILILHLILFWNYNWELKFVLANGSARARPNRWMGGGGPGPLAPSEVSELHATNTARPRSPNKAHVRARPSRGTGGGGDGGEYPRQLKFS